VVRKTDVGKCDQPLDSSASEAFVNTILIQHGLDLMSLMGTLAVFGLASAIGQLAFMPAGDMQYRLRRVRHTRPELRAIAGGSRARQPEAARSAA